MCFQTESGGGGVGAHLPGSAYHGPNKNLSQTVRSKQGYMVHVSGVVK